MDSTKGTYGKALLLAFVFSLNTIVGFACSLSGGFHGFHHQPTKPASHGSHHNHGAAHHHEQDAPKKHHHNPGSSEQSKEDCCSKNVLEMEKKDKSVSRAIGLQPISFFTSFVISYPPLFLSLPANDKTVCSYSNVRCRVPTTIQDLRIVMQSFQI